MLRVGVRVGLIPVTVLLLRWAAPDPGALAAALDDPTGRVREEGLDAAVAGAAGAVGWLVLLWAAVGVLLVGAAGLPGVAGRVAEVAAGRAVPAGMRRLVTIALGLTLTGATGDAALAAPPGPFAATPQAAAPAHPASDCPPPSPPAVRPDGRPYGWPPGGSGRERSSRSPAPPSERSRPGAPALDRPPGGSSREASPLGVDWPLEAAAPPWPTVTVDWPLDAAGERVRPRATGDQPERRVIVSAGDTLWSIAARGLDPGASAAEVAAAWPRWYEANRAVIGPDPARLRPGRVLRVPRAP